MFKERDGRSLGQDGIINITPDLNSEEKKKASGITIVVPKDWGTPNDRLDTLEYIFSGEENRRTIKQLRALDIETRSKMEAMGFEIIERAENDPSTLKENEFTIRGQKRDIQDETELVRQVAPEILIPAKFAQREFEQKPFLPAVMSAGMHKGQLIYLIESGSQLHILQDFFAHEGKQVHGLYKYSEFIETPSSHFTSYRVIVSPLGKIMASALFYSKATKDEPDYIESDLGPERLGLAGSNYSDFLEVPESPYYLHSKLVVSNLAQGGNLIALNPTGRSKPASPYDIAVLADHGITEQRLPDKLVSASQEIGKFLGRHRSLFTGIDFMQGRDGKFYYLECNPGTGVESYLAVNNMGQGSEEDGVRMATDEVLQDLAMNQ